MPPRKRKSLGPYIDWWPEGEPVDLRVEHIDDTPVFPRESFVRFRVNQKMYSGFFPQQYVSPEKMVLSAIICGDTDEGWFVRIPDETFQGGPQIIIPEHEKDTLIIRYPERMKYDLE